MPLRMTCRRNAIRIEGEDIDRLFEAAHYAHA